MSLSKISKGEIYMNKASKLATGLAFAACAVVSNSALADVSYNAAWTSEYYFRGILQKESSASAGIDFTQGGFYAGAWTADVGDGLEVDGYGGFNFATEGGLTAKVGVTGYYYTGEFDDTYEEINLGLGYQMLSLEYSFGEYDGFGAPADYDFFAATLTKNGFYGKYGSWGDDFDGDYFEFGYGFSLAEIDMSIAAIFNDEDLSDQTDSSGAPDDGQALTFTIKKVW
jgi:uncharacterized protein (TIGR02001 family)